jgi:polyphenol oxidase
MSRNNTFTANWIAPTQVKTLITTRDGGHSTDEFSSFNLALHVDDNPELVLQNRLTLQKQLPDKPYWLNQTHSNRVVNLDLINHGKRPNSTLKQLNATSQCLKINSEQIESEDAFKPETVISPLEYDASITTCHQKVCVVLTADCLPILVTNKQGTFVAAVHAGWRGVENGILKNIIKTSASNPHDILIYIGPAICQKHFEVGHEVMEQFIKLDPENSNFFIKRSMPNTLDNKCQNKNLYSNNVMGSYLLRNDKDDKYSCDLAEIAKLQLLKLGVFDSNIYLSNICTYCNENLFYSYRKQNITGRFASLIWLE